MVYGPPGAPGYMPGQSRARGLTRAILDTFPIVKFGRTEDETVPPAAVGAKDVESAGQPASGVVVRGEGEGGEQTRPQQASSEDARSSV